MTDWLAICILSLPNFVKTSKRTLDNGVDEAKNRLELQFSAIIIYSVKNEEFTKSEKYLLPF